MTKITRFAPSPTGNLHIGGVRTALFNYVYFKNHSLQTTMDSHTLVNQEYANVIQMFVAFQQMRFIQFADVSMPSTSLTNVSELRGLTNKLLDKMTGLSLFNHIVVYINTM